MACGEGGTLGALLRDLSQEYASIDDLPAICTLPLGTAMPFEVRPRPPLQTVRVEGRAQGLCCVKARRQRHVVRAHLNNRSKRTLFHRGPGLRRLPVGRLQAPGQGHAEHDYWAAHEECRRLFLRDGAPDAARVPAKEAADARPSGRVRCAYVDPRRGDAAIPVETGLLYEGSATLACAEVPVLRRRRLFPFARSDKGGGGRHLRIAVMSPWRFVPAFMVFSKDLPPRHAALDFMSDDE